VLPLSGDVVPTPMICRKTGRHPKRTRKDGGRGSGRGLTRAFAGSKLLLIASLPAPGHTVLALVVGDGWQMDALVSRIDSPSPLLARMSGTLSCVPWA